MPWIYIFLTFNEVKEEGEERNIEDRRGNSGVSWDHSSQKIFELAENIWQNAPTKL